MAEDPFAAALRAQESFEAGLSRFRAVLEPVEEAERLRVKNERLRVLVQALEEECAARQEEGRRLRGAVRLLLHVTARRPGGQAEQDAWDQLVDAANAHDALVARYAPGAPTPSPDPVEGDSGTLSAGEATT